MKRWRDREHFKARVEEWASELLHFSVPNHGKLSKSLLRAYLGNYEASESHLRKRASRPRQLA